MASQWNDIIINIDVTKDNAAAAVAVADAVFLFVTAAKVTTIDSMTLIDDDDWWRWWWRWSGYRKAEFTSCSIVAAAAVTNAVVADTVVTV